MQPEAKAIFLHQHSYPVVLEIVIKKATDSFQRTGCFFMETIVNLQIQIVAQQHVHRDSRFFIRSAIHATGYASLFCSL